MAAEPHLAHHVLDLFRADKIADQAPAIFNYLFVVATGPAYGAKDNIIGYRFRTSEERDAAFRAQATEQQVILRHHVTDSVSKHERQSRVASLDAGADSGESS